MNLVIQLDIVTMRVNGLLMKYTNYCIVSIYCVGGGIKTQKGHANLNARQRFVVLVKNHRVIRSMSLASRTNSAC